ncbi:MAG: hypothetical protein KJ043_12665 [Anaerolineae bacterium]|nr:hypothetical protein [Anaerolineae bacterium]
MPILRLAWERFNVIGSVLGDVQGKVIAQVLYFTILVPFGVGSRLFIDPMAIRGKDRLTTTWVERPAVPSDLNSAREQG